MNIDSISDSDFAQDSLWKDWEEVASWNGRNLTTLNGKPSESRISSTALQRVQFKNTETGFILCKNEKDSGSSSNSSNQSNDKSSKSEADSKRSNDSDPKSSSDTKQSVSVVGKTSKDNHGKSSNSVGARYNASRQNKDGTSFEMKVEVEHERRNDRNELSDVTSGEITASYNF